MAQLVDTSVFIETERRGHQPHEVTTALLGETVLLAAITVSELLVGVHRAATERQRAQREQFVETVISRSTIIPFDEHVARVHARLWADLATAGQMIGGNDLIIAATALAHGHRLLTYNVREFARVPGLQLSIGPPDRPP